MAMISCPGCGAVTTDDKNFCGICGAALQEEAEQVVQAQSLASREANARLAAGKRLRAEDKAILMTEAAERGEKVSRLELAGVGIELVGKLIGLIFFLIIMVLMVYSCATA